MSTVSTEPVTAGRAMFDGWRHAVPILPAVLLITVLTTFNLYVAGAGFLAMLVGASMLRPMSFARLTGLAAGLVTGWFIVYAALWAMFRNADF